MHRRVRNPTAVAERVSLSVCFVEGKKAQAVSRCKNGIFSKNNLVISRHKQKHKLFTFEVTYS